MQLPVSYLDVAAIEEIPLDTWKEVFGVTGWPPSLESKVDTFTHHDVVTAFERDDLSDYLLQALETLDTLGNESGREAIVEAMKDRGVSIDTLPRETGVRELALRLFLAQQHDAAMADVFARARIQTQDSDQRRYNEFMGKDARSVATLGAKVRTLEERVLQYCQNSDLGNHVEVRAFEDDGVYTFNVIRSHRIKKPLAVVPGHTARATIQYRPVHSDILRYEASVGRLRIIARAASMVEFYRGALGAILFGDETFFEGEPVCDLSVLQERGRAALDDHNVVGVGQVRMTECLWERGDQLLQFRGNDCFRAIEDLELTLSEGRILQAKLKVQVIGKSRRPVIVNIRVPSRIEISQKPHEGLMEKVLAAIGVRNVAPRRAIPDLWSAQAGRQPVAVWRDLFGSGLDELVQQGVLTTVRLDSISHPQQPEAGRVLEAHPLEDSGDFYGVSRMPEIPSRTVSPTDLDGLELHPEKLRLYLASRLGIDEGGSVWDGHELVDLGIIKVGDQRIHLTYALRHPGSGIGDGIRARSNGAHPVILVPSPQQYSSDLSKVVLDSAMPERTDVIRQAIAACGLTKLVPARHIAPESTRLVVDGQFQKVWIDGVEIEGLVPASQSFRFVEKLAKESPASVSSDDMSTYLSPGRQDGSTTARQAKAKVRKLIRETMTKVGRNFEEDIFPPAGTGHYRCTLACYVRD